MRLVLISTSSPLSSSSSASRYPFFGLGVRSMPNFSKLLQKIFIRKIISKIITLLWFPVRYSEVVLAIVDTDRVQLWHCLNKASHFYLLSNWESPASPSDTPQSPDWSWWVSCTASTWGRRWPHWHWTWPWLLNPSRAAAWSPSERRLQRR